MPKFIFSYQQPAGYRVRTDEETTAKWVAFFETIGDAVVDPGPARVRPHRARRSRAPPHNWAAIRWSRPSAWRTPSRWRSVPRPHLIGGGVQVGQLAELPPDPPASQLKAHREPMSSHASPPALHALAAAPRIWHRRSWGNAPNRMAKRVLGEAAEPVERPRRLGMEAQRALVQKGTLMRKIGPIVMTLVLAVGSTLCSAVRLKRSPEAQTSRSPAWLPEARRPPKVSPRCVRLHADEDGDRCDRWVGRCGCDRRPRRNPRRRHVRSPEWLWHQCR